MMTVTMTYQNLRHYNDDSDSESGERVDIEQELKELDEMLEGDSSDSLVAKETQGIPQRRTTRSTAGTR
jgi:hypothetical protein